MKKFNQKGITLIALIVTIIVLAITISVSLKLISGSNGIIAKASKSVDANERAQVKEDIELTLAEMKTDYYISEDRTTYGSFENYWKAQLPITTKRGATLIKEMDSTGEESLLTYVTRSGVQYDVSTNENIVSGPLTGSEEDDIPPTIGTPVTGATTASVTLVDVRGSGVASYIVKEENIAPTEDDEGWIDLPEVSKSYRLNLTGLQVNKTYYIFAKDAQGNISEATAVTTKEVDAATSSNLTVTNTTWENTNATVTFNTSTEYKIQLSSDGTNWNNPAVPNTITVPSGTAIYARLADEYGNLGSDYQAFTPCKTGIITYDANGGEGEVPEPQTAQHTETVTVSFSPLPTKDEYTFLGWSQNSSDRKPTYKEGKETFEMGTEDVTLYAIWTNDTTVPELTTFTGALGKITFAAKDDESEINGYAITQSNVEPEEFTEWTGTSNTQNVANNTDYYLWIQNGAELVSSKKFRIHQHTGSSSTYGNCYTQPVYHTHTEECYPPHYYVRYEWSGNSQRYQCSYCGGKVTYTQGRDLGRTRTSGHCKSQDVDCGKTTSSLEGYTTGCGYGNGQLIQE